MQWTCAFCILMQDHRRSATCYIMMLGCCWCKKEKGDYHRLQSCHRVKKTKISSRCKRRRMLPLQITQQSHNSTTSVVRCRNHCTIYNMIHSTQQSTNNCGANNNNASSVKLRQEAVHSRKDQ